MDTCPIPYIPCRLHAGDKPDIPEFEVGEKLYRRCPEAVWDKPFSTISLVDISINRAGPAAIAPLCEPEDVLFNFNQTEKQPGERIVGEVCRELVVKELHTSGTAQKTVSVPQTSVKPVAASKAVAAQVAATQPDEKAPPIECVIQLLHKKEVCNYAHCVFELKLNGVEVTFKNYKEGLGAKSRDLSALRDLCRQELGKMFLSQEAKEQVVFKVSID